MGYQIRNRVRKNDIDGFRLVFEKVENGKKKQRHIPIQEWNTLGFSSNMTKEEAKERARSINAQSELKRHEIKRNLIAERLQKESLIECAWLPDSLIQAFENDVLFKKYSGGDEIKLQKRKFISHWLAAKRVIRKVNLDPSDWADYSQNIYGVFTELKMSLEYCSKIIRVLNLWGYFYCKKLSKPFLQIKMPTGHYRERIADSAFEKGRSPSLSESMTPDMLEKAKINLKSTQYNWLYLSIWFGLRPTEIDSLKDTMTWKIKEDQGVPVLWVYQSKLTAVPRDRRWKLIPCIFDEQKLGLEIIKSGRFDRR